MQALGGKVCISGLITALVLFFVMYRPIDFDREPGGKAVEVEDVWPERFLTFKDDIAIAHF